MSETEMKDISRKFMDIGQKYIKFFQSVGCMQVFGIHSCTEGLLDQWHELNNATCDRYESWIVITMITNPFPCQYIYIWYILSNNKLSPLQNHSCCLKIYMRSWTFTVTWQKKKKPFPQLKNRQKKHAFTEVNFGVTVIYWHAKQCRFTWGRSRLWIQWAALLWNSHVVCICFL